MQDSALLTQYAQNNSEAAFSQLMKRHLPLVFRTCRRELHSDTLAEDAAQVVFLLLARKAKTLRAGPSLAGWLYQTSVFVAKDIRKQEVRRTRREEAAMQETRHAQTAPASEWDSIEPHLNAALSALKPADRDAILLRFLEGHTLAETGTLLRISEDAARMRCARALEKLRRSLAAHGAAVPGAALAALLTTEAARPVSAQAASAVTQGTLQALSTDPTANVLLLSKGVSHTMKIIKLKYAALAAGLLLAGASASSIVHAVNPHKASVRQVSQSSSTPNPHLSAPPDLPQKIKLLNLSQPFTLTFKQTSRDVRDWGQKAKQFKEQQNNYSIMVEKGQLTRQEADQILSQMAPSLSSSTPYVTTVTLSARDGKLLYRSQGVRPHDNLTMITDGKQVFKYTEFNHQADIFTGLRWSPPTGPCPLPGVGVPFLPLIKSQATSVPVMLGVKGSESLSSDVVDFPISYSSLTYSPGVAKVSSQEGRLQLTSVAIVVKRETASTWLFSAYWPFQGTWIASNFLWTQYTYGEPAEDYRFTLLSANAQALAPRNFQEETWLPRGAVVTDHTGPAQVGFDYDPNKGDLKSQANHQKFLETQALVPAAKQN